MHRAALSGALMKGLVMPVFSVDTQAVADTASRTRTRIATIQTETDGLKGDISMLQSSWTGGASDSMATCAADWHVTAIQVQSSLDQPGPRPGGRVLRRRRGHQQGPLRLRPRPGVSSARTRARPIRERPARGRTGLDLPSTRRRRVARPSRWGTTRRRRRSLGSHAEVAETTEATGGESIVLPGPGRAGRS